MIEISVWYLWPEGQPSTDHSLQLELRSSELDTRGILKGFSIFTDALAPLPEAQNKPTGSQGNSRPPPSSMAVLLGHAEIWLGNHWGDPRASVPSHSQLHNANLERFSWKDIPL